MKILHGSPISMDVYTKYLSSKIWYLLSSEFTENKLTLFLSRGQDKDCEKKVLVFENVSGFNLEIHNKEDYEEVKNGLFLDSIIGFDSDDIESEFLIYTDCVEYAFKDEKV